MQGGVLNQEEEEKVPNLNQERKKQDEKAKAPMTAERRDQEVRP